MVMLMPMDAENSYLEHVFHKNFETFKLSTQK